MTTVKSITVEEFEKHFYRTPVGYTAHTGLRYVTFVCSMEAFGQLHGPVDDSGKPPDPNKVYTVADHSGNKVSVRVRPYHDPDGIFKMIAVMRNRTTGENIALIAA